MSGSIDPKLAGTQTTHGAEVCNTAGQSLLSLKARYQRNQPRVLKQAVPEKLRDLYQIDSSLNLRPGTILGLEKLAQAFGVSWTEAGREGPKDSKHLDFLRSFAKKFMPHIYPERDAFYVADVRYHMVLDKVFALISAALEDPNPYIPLGEASDAALSTWNPSINWSKFKNYLIQVEGFWDLCTTGVRNDFVSFLSEIKYPGICVVYNAGRFIKQELEKFLWEYLNAWEPKLYAGLIYEWMTGEGEVSIAEQLERAGFQGKFRVYIHEKLLAVGLISSHADTEALAQVAMINAELGKLSTEYLNPDNGFYFTNPPDKDQGLEAGRLWQVHQLNLRYFGRCVDFINQNLCRISADSHEVSGAASLAYAPDLNQKIKKLDQMAKACMDLLESLQTVDKLLKTSAASEDFPETAWEKLKALREILKSGSDEEIKILISQIQENKFNLEFLDLDQYVQNRSSGREIIIRDFFGLWKAHDGGRPWDGLSPAQRDYHKQQQIELLKILLSQDSPIRADDAWLIRHIRPSVIEPVAVDLMGAEVSPIPLDWAPASAEVTLIGPFEFNTIILHAFRTPTDQWTELFTMRLIEALSALETPDALEGIVGEGAQAQTIFLSESLKRDSYPKSLIDFLKTLIQERAEGRLIEPIGLARWIEQWRSNRGIGRAYLIKELKGAPYGLGFIKELFKNPEFFKWVESSFNANNLRHSVQALMGTQEEALTAVAFVLGYFKWVVFPAQTLTSLCGVEVISLWAGKEHGRVFVQGLFENADVWVKGIVGSTDDFLIQVLAEIPGGEVFINSLIHDSKVGSGDLSEFLRIECVLEEIKFEGRSEWIQASVLKNMSTWMTMVYSAEELKYLVFLANQIPFGSEWIIQLILGNPALNIEIKNVGDLIALVECVAGLENGLLMLRRILMNPSFFLVVDKFDQVSRAISLLAPVDLELAIHLMTVNVRVNRLQALNGLQLLHLLNAVSDALAGVEEGALVERLLLHPNLIAHHAPNNFLAGFVLGQAKSLGVGIRDEIKIQWANSLILKYPDLRLFPDQKFRTFRAEDLAALIDTLGLIPGGLKWAGKSLMKCRMTCSLNSWQERKILLNALWKIPQVGEKIVHDYLERFITCAISDAVTELSRHPRASHIHEVRKLTSLMDQLGSSLSLVVWNLIAECSRVAPGPWLGVDKDSKEIILLVINQIQNPVVRLFVLERSLTHIPHHPAFPA